MKERLLSDIEINDVEINIVFDTTKNDLFKINDNLKIISRKLKTTYKINVNRENLNDDNEILKNACLLVLPGPRLMFDDQEIEYLQKFIESGKSILVLGAEGGENNLNTNINQLLEQYGIIINGDCVIRTQYCKYFLPKECYLNDCLSNSMFGYIEQDSNTWCYVYPFGATLTVAKPSVTALTSGNACFPANRPLCAVYLNRNTGGRLVVLGSGHMLADKYIDQEQNEKFCEKLFQYLTDDPANINDIDTDEFDVWDYHMVPDIPMLAEKPQLCLVDSANTVSVDFTKLFNTRLYSLNTDFVPEIIKIYEETNVKHAPLTLIVPRFEEATPRLQLAVFPPLFCELPPPPLELFDLEEEFSAEETQLAQLTNRYLQSADKVESRHDLEQYILEATNILNIGQQDFSPIRQIYECAQLISNFKMSNVSNEITDLQLLGHDFDAISKNDVNVMNVNVNSEVWQNNNLVGNNIHESDVDSFDPSD